MKKEFEEFQKAYANAMKHDIDYSYVVFKDSDLLPDWVGVKCRVEGVLIDFAFNKSRALFIVHNLIDNESIIQDYFTDDDLQELHKKVIDAYYNTRLDSIDSKIEALNREREQISVEKISVEQNQTI